MYNFHILNRGDGMNRIRDLRQARGWTQEELGARLNVGKGAVSRYEKELRQLEPALICTLCDLFGCTADYLLCRTESPLPVISDEDARILAAYHAASVRDRALVDQILAATMPSDQEEAAASS